MIQSLRLDEKNLVAGDKRRKVTEVSLAITLDYLAKKCATIDEPRDACLIALLYLSGRRVGEVLPLQRKDFQVTEDHRIVFTTFNEKTFRIKMGGGYKIPRRGVYYEEINPQFSLTSPSGLALGKYVYDYLETLEDKDYLFAPLKHGNKYISRAMAWLIVKHYIPNIWCHLLRHLRFTAYARQFKDDPLKMHPLTFHKHFESTLQYIHREETKESVHEV